MNQSILITAGGTSEPIDSVRVLTNRSTGKTGVNLALLAYQKGWNVELLLARGLYADREFPFPVHRFETVDELGALMEQGVRLGKPGALAHVAAVSDYVMDFVESTGPDRVENHPPNLDKISGHLPSLRIVLKPAPRLLAKIRTDWNFRGFLVSFKLETDPEKLLVQARRSLKENGSDLVVGNTWDGHEKSAILFLGPDSQGQSPPPITIPRGDLPKKILDFAMDFQQGKGL